MILPAAGRRAPANALRNWVAVSVAAAAVLVVLIVIASFWAGLGESEISVAGWLAMGLGVIITLALGIGLMALVFISSRRGYDEIGGKDRGRFVQSGLAPYALATVHPSSLLRAPDEETRHREIRRFIEDLQQVVGVLE